MPPAYFALSNQVFIFSPASTTKFATPFIMGMSAMAIGALGFSAIIRQIALFSVACALGFFLYKMLKVRILFYKLKKQGLVCIAHVSDAT